MSECLYGAETRGDALSLVASALSFSKSKMPWSPKCKIPMQRSAQTSIRGRDRPGPRQTAGGRQSQAWPTPGRNQFSAATQRRCESSGAKVVPPCAVGAEHKSETAEPPMARPAEVNGRGDLGQNTLYIFFQTPAHAARRIGSSGLPSYGSVRICSTYTCVYITMYKYIYI